MSAIESRQAAVAALVLALAVGSLGGCGLVIGLDDYERVDGNQPWSNGAGGMGGSTTSTATGPIFSGSGGAGGDAIGYGWVRLVNMSPDSMGVDFCLTDANGTYRTSGYPAAGVTYPGAGAYVAFPTPEAYQIEIVAAGQTCSSTPIGIGPDYSITTGSYHAVIVDGLQVNASLAVGTVPEDNVPTTAGMVFLNAFHENSGAPAVQIGTVDATDTFTSLFGDGVALAYQEYTSAEIPPVAMGTVLAVSADGVTVDGRWTMPADLATGGVSVFITGTDAAYLGMYACINLANTCLALPTAN